MVFQMSGNTSLKFVKQSVKKTCYGPLNLSNFKWNYYWRWSKLESEPNPNLINKINTVIKNAVGDGRDYLSDAESIYVLKITDALVKEYKEVLAENQWIFQKDLVSRFSN